jgi:serine protease AprX
VTSWIPQPGVASRGPDAEKQSVGLSLRRFLRALLPAILLLSACTLPAATGAMPLIKAGSPVSSDGHGHPKKPEKPSKDDDDDEGDDEDKGKNDKGSGGNSSSPVETAPAPAKPADPPVTTTEAPRADAEPDRQPPVAATPAESSQQVVPGPLAENPKVDPVLAAVAVEVGSVDPAQPLRLLVFGDDASAASASVGAEVRRELDGSVTSVSLPVGSLDELVAQKGIGFVMLDVPVRPTSEADPFSSPWADFPLLDAAPEAWKRGRTGRGVGVAVLDSGVGVETAFGDRLVHVDLGRGVRPDAHGHGTFVAGVLAGDAPDGTYTGIAPGARVFDVNVSQTDGVYSSDVIAGLEWVLVNHRRHNIRVVNLSLAETLPSSYRTNPLDATVERLWRQGVVVIAAAGNLGPGSVVYAPANDPYVITVGALDQGITLDRYDDLRASFSATGPTLDGFAKPDLLAPGRRIVSLLPAATTLGRQAPAANMVAPGLAFMSGTSFAAPQVAGAAAILLQQHPRWTPDQVKGVLTRTTRPVTASTAGTLDLRHAVLFKGTPYAANRSLRAEAGGRTAPDGGDFGPDTWSSNTWTSNTWTSNTWTSNTWTAALQDWFMP